MVMPKVDRRGLLVGGAATVGLVVAFVAWPRAGGSPLRAAREGEEIFGPYLRIAGDGRVTIAIPQVETGQGIWTGLAQVAADELGADWDMVAVEPAPVMAGYDNPLAKKQWGVATRITAGSTSIRAFEAPLREAAATARALLCAAAGEKWGVTAAECETFDGQVRHGGRAIGFGELVERAARIGRPGASRLRAVGSGGLSGKPLRRLDLAAKASGSWRFASDVRLPDMMFASIRIAPPGGRLRGFDRAAAERPDIRLVVRDHWLGAIGSTWWAAEAALKRAGAQFSGPTDADTPTIERALHAALDKGEFARFAESGDYDAATRDMRPLAATYMAAPAVHLSLDQPAAVVRFNGGQVEIWAATLAPDLARAKAASAAGIGADDVTLYPMPVGDNGGRGLDTDVIALAIDLAREAKRPVSLTYPASVAQNRDRPRPPMLARMSALPDPAGGLASWHASIVGAAGIDAALARAGSQRVPDFVPRGAVPPYAVGALRVESATARLPIATGYLRGDVEALTSFATESFIDELARARGMEPLAFRVSLLSGKPRLARALMSAAALGGWDGGGRGSAMGIACASAYDSHIGLVAEATIGADQRVSVTRLVAAVDCGRTINPELVRQQVEGGLLHALVNAAGPVPEIIAGVVRARPLAALGLGALGKVPKVEVQLIDSPETPGGVSGLGALVLPAAIGNAIFAATAQRLRRLPFDPMTPA
jgi:isoquinoline 1-oxidoreductase beta subunit